MKTDQPYHSYLSGLCERLKQDAEIMEKERLDLLERIKPAGSALKAIGAESVMLFGSILRSGEFDRASDIDILVCGLDDANIWNALGTVERAVSIFEREIDLVFEQMADAGLVADVRRNGIEL